MTERDAARLCLVGCGAIGGVHLRAARHAHDRVVHCALHDVRPESAQELVRRLGIDLPVIPRWEDILSDPTLDGVDLCLPHSLHVRYALEAIAAGKHVFLEKPMALSSADCSRLIDAARARGVHLSVMHNRRFNATSLAVKALLDRGDLGEPFLLTAHGIEGPDTVGVRSWLSRADQGGVGMAQTVHFAYMVRWLLGPVSEVSCLTSRQGIPWMEGEVSAAFQLRFASGALGQIVSTFAQEAGHNEHRITIYGGKAQATFAGDTLDVLSPRRYGDDAWHRERSDGDWTADFAVPLATFGDAIRGRGELAVPPEEGRDAVALIEAAYRSAREGRAVRLDPA